MMAGGRIDTLIAGGELLTPEGLKRLDLGIVDGRVAGLYEPGTAPPAVSVFEAGGKTVMPGLVDIHFHVRAPAYPERGTVESETRAAAAGGVTTLFEMPISKPCCSTPQIVAERRDHFADNAVVNFGLIAAPGDLTPKTVMEMAELGVVAFKVFTTPAPSGRDDEFGGLSFPSEADQFKALSAVAETGLPLVVHAESAELLALYEAQAQSLDPSHAATHGASRPAVCEAVAVAKLLAMNMTANAKLHIAHVTSAETVAVLRAFAGTSDFTAETCPQYLFATEDDVARAGVYAKVNPPIRKEADREALWAAIADGVLEFVTTDHAPFSLAEKAAAKGNFPAAPPGVPGVEFMLPLMLTRVAEGKLDLLALHRLLSSNGAKRFGLYPRKGSLLPGADADIVIVDPKASHRMTPDRLFSNAREVAQLFAGRHFTGRVEATFVAGKRVFSNGEIHGQRGDGRYVSPVASAMAA